MAEYLVGLPKNWTLCSPLDNPRAKKLLADKCGPGRLPTLDLFSGVGGLSIGLREVCCPIAYCEIEPKARAVLQARMQDGMLERAPVLEDVRVFGLSTTLAFCRSVCAAMASATLL